VVSFFEAQEASPLFGMSVKQNIDIQAHLVTGVSREKGAAPDLREFADQESRAEGLEVLAELSDEFEQVRMPMMMICRHVNGLIAGAIDRELDRSSEAAVRVKPDGFRISGGRGGESSPDVLRESRYGKAQTEP